MLCPLIPPVSNVVRSEKRALEPELNIMHNVLFYFYIHAPSLRSGPICFGLGQGRAVKILSLNLTMGGSTGKGGTNCTPS